MEAQIVTIRIVVAMGKKNNFFKIIKEFVKENLLGLSLFIGFLSLLIFLFSTVAWFRPTVLRGGFEDLAEGVGNWKYILFFVSAAALGVCTYLAYTNWKKRAEFEELMDTDSKAEFIKTLDDVEYLAYQLGSKYEERVIDKKQIFKIK
jgi:hypothetical protein